jgi:NADH:ubiquinone oxidoreductase subunit H
MIPNLIRRFVVMAVAVPLAAAGARKLSAVVESRRGPSRATRLLRQGADTLQGHFGRRKKARRFTFGR